MDTELGLIKNFLGFFYFLQQAEKTDQEAAILTLKQFICICTN